ncbi:hypothetical protein J6T66_03565 [bacterium]|nr:hypothetical protein [bacterium]
MTSRENTATIIGEIIDFELEESGDMNIEQKLEVINQFRIHFKLVPDEVYEIE